jgi:molybdate transport system substrate-binding protein
MRRRRSLLGSLMALCLVAPGVARADEILVSAASSLADAMDEIAAAFSGETGTAVRINFGASGALQRQIEQGAPVDVFASASTKEVDALQGAGRVEGASRVAFAGNRLVLIVPVGSRIRRWEDLRQPSVRRLAISNPDSVPSGRYARETLTRRGLWAAVQPKTILGENVRQTLKYVADGNVDAGIVFATDAAIEKRRVRAVAEARGGRDHAPIVYPAAVVTGSRNAASARRFVRYLRGRAAQRILRRHGFL